MLRIVSIYCYRNEETMVDIVHNHAKMVSCCKPSCIVMSIGVRTNCFVTDLLQNHVHAFNDSIYVRIVC